MGTIEIQEHLKEFMEYPEITNDVVKAVAYMIKHKGGETLEMYEENKALADAFINEGFVDRSGNILVNKLL